MALSLLSSAHALGAYLEPLLSGRRVAVVGSVEWGLGPRLAALGARWVHVYDPDAARVAAFGARGPGRKGVVVRELPAEDWDVREGAFDVAMVTDLSSLPDPARLLSSLRRVLSREGVLLAMVRHARCAPPGEGLGYNELLDLMALQFEQVRVVAGLPFEGITLAELGGTEGPVEVHVDTQLAPEDPSPEVLVALGSRRPFVLEPYCIVQISGNLPLEEGPGGISLKGGEGPGGAPLGGAGPDPRFASPSDVPSMGPVPAPVLEDGARWEGRIVALEGALREAEEELSRERERSLQLLDELEREKERRLAAERRGISEMPPSRVAEAELTAALHEKAKEGEELRQRLEALADDSALREGDRVLLGWRVAELEAALDASKATLDALRLELSRERAARAAGEPLESSGDPQGGEASRAEEGGEEHDGL